MKENLMINENPDREKWSDFVYRHPQGNIFQTPFMFDVYRLTPNNNAGALSLEDQSGNMLGLIVYTLISEPGVKRFFSKRAIVSGGPVIKDNNAGYTEALLKGYHAKIRKENAIYTEIRNLFDVKALHPALSRSKFKYEDHLTIHMNLTKTVKELESALHRGRASNIKRAEKKNVQVRDIATKEEIQAAYELIRQTYDRINLPSPPLELFLNASEVMKNHIKFTGAFLDGKLIGCRVYLIYKDFIYDWYAAGDRDYSGYHPSDLLPWKNMLWAKENKINTYDFAGAGKPGKEYTVRDYKLKFGGELINLGRYQSIHNPLLFRVGVMGMKMYRYLKKV